MKIREHLDKENFHHAYLIEGSKDEVVLEVSNFIESLGIKVSGNPDFCHISTDIFKIDDYFKALLGV